MLGRRGSMSFVFEGAGGGAAGSGRLRCWDVGGGHEGGRSQEDCGYGAMWQSTRVPTTSNTNFSLHPPSSLAPSLL